MLLAPHQRDTVAETRMRNEKREIFPNCHKSVFSPPTHKFSSFDASHCRPVVAPATANVGSTIYFSLGQTQPLSIYSTTHSLVRSFSLCSLIFIIFVRFGAVAGCGRHGSGVLTCPPRRRRRRSFDHSPWWSRSSSMLEFGFIAMQKLCGRN